MTEQAGKPLADKKSANDADTLDALKSLLLGEEQQQLERINKRLDDTGVRGSDVAEVLPDSVRLSHQEGTALTDALEGPVTTCIQRRIERNPDSFADALYPVMGPAIRQSISATLKDLVNNINRTLEHSLSAQGLKWRLEAMRSGVPFPEVVLRHTLSYRVEQVFLIQNDSGLLMQHVQDELAVKSDPDAVSGMLTAIAQFVRDAFQAGEKEGLEQVEIGDHTVLLVHGPSAYLACVVRGIPPGQMRQHCQEVIEQLHGRYARPLAEFNGDPNSLAVSVPLLESCLLSEEKETTRRSGLAPATIFLLLLLIAGIGWGLLHWWSNLQAGRELHAQQQALVAALREEPGLVVTETHYGPHLQITGLQDPLARSPASLLAESALQKRQVELAFSPYLDIRPDFALQRARTRLNPPAGVDIEIDAQGRLSVSGIAPNRWVERASLLAATVPGVNAYDDSRLLSHDAHLLQRAMEVLKPGDSATLTAQNGRLVVQGQAPQAWIKQLQTLSADLPYLKSLDLQVKPLEQAQLDALLMRLDNSRLLFAEGTLLQPSEETYALELAKQLQQALLLGDQLGYWIQIVVTGRTDGVGTLVYNDQLALARALIARDILILQGVPAERLRIQTSPGLPGNSDPAMRRAELSMLVHDAPQPEVQ